jgi:hypothetical protein
MAICADGTHLPTALIVKTTIPEESYIDYDSMQLHIYRTEKGFITRMLFVYHMKTVILPSIKERQDRFARGGQLPPALLILDGHSSRLCRGLWEDCALKNIDVAIFPSHTSHIMQPLDRGVNARFKFQLGIVRALPKKRCLGREMHDWLEQVEDAIEIACSRKGVRNSFQSTGLFPFSPAIVLDDVPQRTKYPGIKERAGIRISGKVVTDPMFLNEWKKSEEEKTERSKECERKRTKRKKRKPLIPSSEKISEEDCTSSSDNAILPTNPTVDSDEKEDTLSEGTDEEDTAVDSCAEYPDDLQLRQFRDSEDLLVVPRGGGESSKGDELSLAEKLSLFQERKQRKARTLSSLLMSQAEEKEKSFKEKMILKKTKEKREKEKQVNDPRLMSYKEAECSESSSDDAILQKKKRSRLLEKKVASPSSPMFPSSALASSPLIPFVISKGPEQLVQGKEEVGEVLVKRGRRPFPLQPPILTPHPIVHRPTDRAGVAEKGDTGSEGGDHAGGGGGGGGGYGV